MTQDRKGMPGHDQRGYKPIVVGDGYRPLPGTPPSGTGKPGAGHQPAEGGQRPPLPAVGTGVKPPPKKE